MKYLLSILALMIGLHGPAHASEKKDESATPKTTYLELQPSVVVNLAKGGKHLRLDAQLMLKSEADLAEIKPHVPAIINQLILLASDQDGSLLKEAEGKEHLRKAALMAVNGVIKELTGKDQVVSDLFFSQFFVR